MIRYIDYLSERLLALEKHFEADFFNVLWDLLKEAKNLFLKIIEDLASDPQKKDKIYIVLTTSGGMCNCSGAFCQYSSSQLQ